MASDYSEADAEQRHALALEEVWSAAEVWVDKFSEEEEEVRREERAGAECKPGRHLRVGGW